MSSLPKLGPCLNFTDPSFTFSHYFWSHPEFEMSHKVIEDPPLSCLAGWSEVQLCFGALQVLHFLSLSLPLPPLIVLIEPCGPVAQPDWLRSAGLPCAFYLYFMLWRCALHSHTYSQREHSPRRTQNADSTKSTQQSFKHLMFTDPSLESCFKCLIMRKM